MSDSSVIDNGQPDQPGRDDVIVRLREIRPWLREWHLAYFEKSGFTSPEAHVTSINFNPSPSAKQRYLRIENGGSAFCFVELETGDIYKAAGWKAPAKGVRGNIFNDADVERTMSNPYGGGFYAR